MNRKEFPTPNANVNKSHTKIKKIAYKINKINLWINDPFRQFTHIINKFLIWKEKYNQIKKFTEYFVAVY